jgi:hypothetical protein
MEKATKVVASQTGNEPPLKTPHGLDEIIASFGDIREYVEADGQLEARWQVDFLERVSLPFSLRLSWDPSRTITHVPSRSLLIALRIQINRDTPSCAPTVCCRCAEDEKQNTRRNS